MSRRDNQPFRKSSIYLNTPRTRRKPAQYESEKTEHHSCNYACTRTRTSKKQGPLDWIDLVEIGEKEEKTSTAYTVLRSLLPISTVSKEKRSCGNSKMGKRESRK